jgi:cyanophycinase
MRKKFNNNMGSMKECPVPAGILVIIGGKEKKGKEASSDPSVGPEILKRFLELTGKEQALIQVITSGSEEGEASFREYKEAFGKLGQQRVEHLHHSDRQEVVSDKGLLQKVRSADAFFFAGGDQLLLTSMYGGTAMLTLLKERYIDEKVIIGGTSAGAMAMSTPMIYAGNEEVQQLSGEIKVTTGMEFLRDVCIDTHFVHRGRFIRLAQVIATNPGCTGLGVEENTALIIQKGVEAEVAGGGTVIRIEGFDMSGANMKNFTEKKPFSVRNLSVDILAQGDKLRIQQRNPPHQ